VEAERRQISVLFHRMAGFTTFSARSGEEAALAPGMTPATIESPASFRSSCAGVTFLKSERSAARRGHPDELDY
jgi:hypothetical protein